MLPTRRGCRLLFNAPFHSGFDTHVRHLDVSFNTSDVELYEYSRSLRIGSKSRQAWLRRVRLAKRQVAGVQIRSAGDENDFSHVGFLWFLSTYLQGYCG